MRAYSSQQQPPFPLNALCLLLPRSTMTEYLMLFYSNFVIMLQINMRCDNGYYEMPSNSAREQRKERERERRSETNNQ